MSPKTIQKVWFKFFLLDIFSPLDTILIDIEELQIKIH